MQRFILEKNIDQFEQLLMLEPAEASRATLQRLLHAARRELANLDAVTRGVALDSSTRIGSLTAAHGRVAEFRRLFEASETPYLLLHPGPGLRIVDINDAYASATLTERSKVAGELMFNVFPDNPADDLADGVSNLFASLRAAAESANPHTMRVQRYDIRDRQGRFVERHWSPLNTPLFDDDGRLVALLHRVEDVTAKVAAPPPP